ncbi:hypothetical protein RclHR1_22120001 [Rhizophagus clarus]|uniref:Uncharacterized protein n=1 Tax=Rhizophagus clarus TaxID=94130 RepID=A0A2Z6RNH9_9GLOM|nr:hypothetical protein RclHR1_22120001 [Rhizophagus clarus]GES75442.1 hypothetical protein RCL_e8877_RclHR1_22120001 [Rhizophagus clarus]
MVSLFFLRLGFKKHPPVRFGNTGSTFKYTKPTPYQDTNSHFIGNHRFHNQNMKDKSLSNSDRTTKKNSYHWYN